MKKSPIQTTEGYCSVVGVCPYFEQTNTINKCNYYKKKLEGGPMESASPRLKECLATDPIFQEWKHAVTSRKIRGHKVTVYEEYHPRKSDYKFYGRVKDLPGCFIVGDTPEQVLARAPGVIKLFIDAEKGANEKPRLISIQFRHAQYEALVKFAKDRCLTISAAVRLLALDGIKRCTPPSKEQVKKTREKVLKAMAAIIKNPPKKLTFEEELQWRIKSCEACSTSFEMGLFEAYNNALDIYKKGK